MIRPLLNWGVRWPYTSGITTVAQNQESGAAASKWGKETARRLAAALGVSSPSGTSNECSLDGLPVVIKCAGRATDSVGVTFRMLTRVARVIGAFEDDRGEFDVWGITPRQFETHMRDTASKGASAGKVGLVRRSVFEASGAFIGHVRLASEERPSNER